MHTTTFVTVVSTGLLVFPSSDKGSAFGNLQIQGMSLYLMRYVTCMPGFSTILAYVLYSMITSQVVMTFGGSLFPGALGSMLIEVLPFLRNIATSLRNRLGDDSPSLLPTVMAVYALTSLLTGVVFTVLGVFRCGRIVRLCAFLYQSYDAYLEYRSNISQELSSQE